MSEQPPGGLNSASNDELQARGKLHSDLSLDTLYRLRFPQIGLRAKNDVWRVICTRFFSRYIPIDSTVVDIGAGYCEFINNIDAKRRIAVDANPDLGAFAATGVEVHCTTADTLDFLGDNSIDVVFSSNFFEHLPTKPALTRLTRQLLRVIKPGGRLMVMGPNIKCVAGDYWDYYDHHIPLTERSIVELLQICGFKIEKSLPRFLPYTFKSRLPTWPWLVRAYLLFGKVTFPLFGKQFFVIGRKPN